MTSKDPVELIRESLQRLSRLLAVYNAGAMSDGEFLWRAASVPRSVEEAAAVLCLLPGNLRRSLVSYATSTMLEWPVPFDNGIGSYELDCEFTSGALSIAEAAAAKPHGPRYLSLVSLTPPKVPIVPCDTAAHAVIEVGGKRYRATKCTDDGVPFLAWRDADEIKDGAP